MRCSRRPRAARTPVLVASRRVTKGRASATACPPARRRPQRLAFSDAGIIAGLLAVGVALPALLALSAHAFGIPRYDDWAYRRVLFHFADSGHLRLVGWGAMTLVGQIFWAAPFAIVLGDHAWVPGLAVAVLSAIGVVAAYLLARSFLRRAGLAPACS